MWVLSFREASGRFESQGVGTYRFSLRTAAFRRPSPGIAVMEDERTHTPKKSIMKTTDKSISKKQKTIPTKQKDNKTNRSPNFLDLGSLLVPWKSPETLFLLVLFLWYWFWVCVLRLRKALPAILAITYSTQKNTARRVC